MDGVECKVLALDAAPRPVHVGSLYSLPAMDSSSITLFVNAGRILRVVARFTRKPIGDRPEAPLLVEATVRYRKPAAGPARPASAPPTAQFRLDGRNQVVGDIAWSPDGKTIASTATLGGCTMMSVETGKVLGTIPTISRLRTVFFAPDGRYLVLPDKQESRLLTLDAATGKELRSVPIGAFNYLVVSPDRSRALAWNRRDSRNVPRVVDCLTGQTLYELPSAVRSRHLQFSADGSRLVALYSDHVEIKDAATGRDLRTFLCSCGPGDEFGSSHSTQMALSPDVKLLAIADFSLSYIEDRLFGAQTPDLSRVFVLDVETGRLVQSLSGAIGSVTALQFLRTAACSR